MQKFDVGEIVRVGLVDDCDRIFKKDLIPGDKCKIVKYEDSLYKVRFKEGIELYMLGSQLESLEDEKKDIQVKIGEKYRVINNDNNIYGIGEIVTCQYHGPPNYISTFKNKDGHFQRLFHSSVEEIGDEGSDFGKEVIKTVAKADKRYEVIDEWGHGFKMGDIIVCAQEESHCELPVFTKEGGKIRQLLSPHQFVELDTKPKKEENLKITRETLGNGFEFIHVGDITLAVGKGTPIGIAKKHPTDEYDKEFGQGLALRRLIQDGVEKGLLD